jgi:hypothetical protein
MEWKECYAFFSKTLIDGTKARGPLMRRKSNSRWEYRAMTATEIEDYNSSWAW